MSDLAEPFWRSIPRAAAPYAERADERETPLDRALLAAGARLRRPFARGLTRSAHVAALVETFQPGTDSLSDEKLLEAAQDLRPALRRRGFTPELAARSFALVRAAAGRRLGMRHFPVQLVGGHVMLQGMLAEMETGEGKTLTATLPAATAALAGLHVHVVTVNDYLAMRDGEIMRPVYEALGLTVGIVQNGQPEEERQQAYAADICYCTNKDLGFDYLRDTLAMVSRKGRGRLLLEQSLGRSDHLDRLLLRGLHFAIVDEADSVLIDEARTPLIISGGQDADKTPDLYQRVLDIARQLEPREDFLLDQHERSIDLTERGRSAVKELSRELPREWRSARGREELVRQGLSALHLFDLDTHYLVRDGKVQIVDEYTGRVMADRAWERGLQQLIEVKEGCDVTGARATLARITYQRLFRRYLRLAGMTGTGREVAPELEAVYGLRVLSVPTNKAVRRRAEGIRMYAGREQKWQAVLRSVDRLRSDGRPVLIGTRSVAASEELSALLARQNMEHVVLNARQDGEEAAIVSRAGEAGRVTVATNMAGRGTDILLTPEVSARGGLHVILTEFHESARIDRQLFGRCARQGDSGSHEAIVSLEDDIFTRYAPGLARVVASLGGRRTKSLPAWTAVILRAAAQRTAEQINSRARRSTMEQDRRLDSALAFARRTD